MKKFFTLIFALLIAGSVYANCSLYIEDVELEANQNKVTVPIKAHFEHYVSAFQVDLELPAGVTVSNAHRTDEVNIEHLNQEGNMVNYTPSVNMNQANTRYIVLCSVMDYEYDGTAVGVCKYEPNDYTFFLLNLDIDPNFKGGDIHVQSVTACGKDTRSWVTPCDCPYYESDTHISVEGVEPDPVDPHDIGYWLVVGSGADKNYIKMDKNYTYVRIVGSQGETSVPYHFRIDGIDYGAPSDGRVTDMEDLFENPLFPVANNYSIASGHQYLLAVMGYPDREMSYIHAHYADGGGYDSVEEAITDRQVESIRYYNINGVELREPNGVTIVVTTYTDGSHETSKIMK